MELFKFPSWHLQLILVLMTRVALNSALPSTSAGLHKRHDNHRSFENTPASSGHVLEPLAPSFTVNYQSQRIKVSYPAVDVPPMDENEGMAFFGEMATYLPCHDCLLLEMSSNLEYEDGTKADVNTGMWLHHAVFVNVDKVDALCGKKPWGQRFYATGNEKTTIDMSAHRHIGGYHIAKNDQVAMSVDLMNMSHRKQKVVFSTTYEFIPDLPKHYVNVEPLWLDVGGCGSSDVPAQVDSSFVFSSSSWISQLTGNLTFAAGHLHDGGTQLQLFKNGSMVCETKPVYRIFDQSMSHGEAEHIDSISTCSEFATTKPGDEWNIKAFYNTSLHSPMKRMDGSLEPIMGVSLFYIAKEDDGGHGQPSMSKGNCNWWLRSNIVPLTICVALVAALISFRRYQNRQCLREGPIRLAGKSLG